MLPFIALIGQSRVVRLIVVQGSPCGQCTRCSGSVRLRWAEDAFPKVIDSVGVARVPPFQQERIGRPLPRSAHDHSVA